MAHGHVDIFPIMSNESFQETEDIPSSFGLTFADVDRRHNSIATAPTHHIAIHWWAVSFGQCRRRPNPLTGGCVPVDRLLP